MITEVVNVVLDLDDGLYVVTWTMADDTKCSEVIEAPDLDTAVLQAAKIAGVHYSRVKIVGEDTDVPRI